MSKAANEDAEAEKIAADIVAMCKDRALGRAALDGFYIGNTLLSGNKEAARKSVVAMLRTGCAPAMVQLLAADLLEPQTQQRGRPAHARPSRWWEVGNAYKDLRETNPGQRNIKALVAHKLGMSESEVARAYTFYQKVDKALDAKLPAG